jgi:hypothetical protein
MSKAGNALTLITTAIVGTDTLIINRGDDGGAPDTTGNPRRVALNSLFRRDNIGATSTVGLLLTNAEAATVGAQQWSPAIQLTGQGWKTNSTAASQTVDWRVDRPTPTPAHGRLTTGC